jgi:hypothetical protein
MNAHGIDRDARMTLAFMVYVVTALAVLSVTNVPGWFVPHANVRASGKYGPHFEGFENFAEHGWPWTYLKREAVNGPGPTSEWRLSRWRFWEGIVKLNAVQLFVNVALIAAVTVPFAVYLSQWLLARRSWWQFSLSELAILIFVCSAGLGWYAVLRSGQLSDMRTLQSIAQTPSDSSSRDSLAWNRSIVQRAEWSDSTGTKESKSHAAWARVVAIDTSDDELPKLINLKHLVTVRIWNGASPRTLAQLKRFPRLEALDLGGFGHISEDDLRENGEIEIPKLPQLRGLNLYETPFRGKGLEHLTNLENLDVSGTLVDDRSLPALKQMRSLRLLSLWNTKVSRQGIEQLREALPACDIESDYEVEKQ